MKYRKEIDGLRALAVLPVILFHAGFATFSGGFVGVDIFFVISGYLITTIIVDEMSKGSFSLLNFYERRARRILPALFFVMLFTLPFAWLWMLPQDLKSFSQSLVAVPLFASNVLFWLTSGYFNTVSELKPLLHTWSLAIEEQYYILFPLFLILAWKLGKKWIISLLIIVAVLSVSAAQYSSINHPSFTFYLLPTRAFEILIGALISFYIHHKQSIISVSQPVRQTVSLAGLALVLFAIFAFDSKTPSPSLYTLIPTIGAGLILVFANDKNIVGKLLSTKIFVGIGLISYSAYLWHQPLFAFAKLRTLDELTNPQLIGLSLSAIGLGYLSWKFIENPFRNKKIIKVKTLIYFGMLLTILFTTIGLIGHLKKGFPDRVSEQITKLLNNPQEPFTNELCAKRYPLFRSFNACLISKNESPEILIIGDSHSQHYFKSTSSALIDKSVMNLGAWSCLPFASKKYTSFDNCSEKIDAAVKFATGTDSIKVIILSGYWSYLSSGGFNIQNQNYRLPDLLTKTQSESFIQAGKKVLDEIRKSGKRVILMKDIPDLDFNIQSCFDMSPYKNNSINQLCSMNYKSYKDRYQAYDDLMFSLTKNYPNLEIYSPTNLFCSNETNACYGKKNSEPLYFNSDHLTVTGSDLVIQDLLNKHPIY
ncbi:acyltransferase [Methylophilaceae bacterium]|nr:acyltransferase [Methylophilaceae bacterium]